ncbi:uncharacterized protein EAF01_010735 [Botrytis porri]|uniref:Glucose-methanol-choline oxidoreductase N-terminal domain-containing protein n=1 Tax=Botrytis porri TaxID=87229 RepID=A0A4Z1KK18_9HELO|nr:uncharacterized protein EAF01_010735 [Botrytis porri]KAF7890926.1 hypothetical protein EAF01_010735 [Botrytis porri]TGO86427.1 hypothetical protein BPOR_0304g00010 [Botrytis porri]
MAVLQSLFKSFCFQALFSTATTSQAVPTYDYIIIGGGTAGLTIASRLSEDPQNSVLVLEAGTDHSSDINVLAPGLYTGMYGNAEYDWNYKSVPQIHANNQVIAHPRGKQLGGSSAINFLYWTHASQQDINSWGELGNANWSWEALDPFFKRSERFVSPSCVIEQDLQTESVVPTIHGENGTILNTFPDIYGPIDEAWLRTFQALGLEVKGDPRDGLALGGYTNLLNLDLDGRKRSYAATAYYLPASKRPNLKVITGALVEKIILEKGHDIDTANGVQYSNGTIAHAKKEVILSAGSIGSPQVLELSGIGDSNILKKQGIEVLVDNRNVGENLQDHVYVPIGFKVNTGITTLDNFTDPAYFDAAYEEYVANATGPLATTGASSGLLSCPQIGCGNLRPPANFSNALTPGLKEQYELQAKYFCGEAVTQELTVSGGMSPLKSNDSSQLFLASSPGNFLSLLGVLEHPFSRGSTHVASSSPSVYPILGPNYLSHPFDLTLLTSIAYHLQSLASVSPLSTYLQGNGTIYQPGYYPLNETNIESFIKANLQSEYHPIGTCSMLPLGKGGVVDEKFRVYGVQGLRVIDASVFPLLVRGNLQSLVYAVAERGAEFIIEDQ